MASDEEFKGRIGRTYRESAPWWPAPETGPADAPNVVFIVLDDVGFSDLGCYGAEIATPHMDRLAAGGLRYNNFHVTAMCSPTRACLLTGRNAHAVGVGAIAEWSNGFPGYQGRITRRAATVAEMLADHGYGTYAVGKWHLANLASYGAAGPHAHWPLGRGFSRWYGFLGGYVDHWNPDLHEDNHPVTRDPRPGYHLSEDLVDHAIAQIRDHVTAAPTRPFFTYLAFGAAHWPHHVPAEFIDRYEHRYDTGWDRIREERFARQKALGLIPADTQLAPRNPGVEAWDSLKPEEKKLYARLQATYAGFMEHTDAQIGRLLEFLEQTGRLDNTLVVLLSDNGASGEGGASGAVNIRKHMLTEKESVEYGLAQMDKIGGEHSFPHYPYGWAQVSNTPLKWYKKNTHGGGIRAPLIMHWPARIKDAGSIRSQYHHVIDVLPTLLESLGVEAPATYRGVEQLPIHGTSMLYTFADRDVPTRKQTQYFEIVGDRALWHQGWKAVARHQKGADFDTDVWNLYDLDADFSETKDLAQEHPARLETMVKLWWAEAEKFGVFPLDDRETERAFDWFKAHTPTRYEYLPGMARADRLLLPAVNNCDWSMDAELDITDMSAQGMIVAFGNRFGGFALYALGGEITFDYIFTESLTHRLRVPMQLGSGHWRVHFAKTGEKMGVLSLTAPDGRLERVEIPRTWSTYGITAGLTCGYANVPLVEALPPPAKSGNCLQRVIVELNPVAAHGAEAFKAILQEE